MRITGSAISPVSVLYSMSTGISKYLDMRPGCTTLAQKYIRDIKASILALVSPDFAPTIFVFEVEIPGAVCRLN